MPGWIAVIISDQLLQRHQEKLFSFFEIIFLNIEKA
jgi:hypothetical protein